MLSFWDLKSDTVTKNRRKTHSSPNSQWTANISITWSALHMSPFLVQHRCFISLKKLWWYKTFARASTFYKSYFSSPLPPHTDNKRSKPHLLHPTFSTATTWRYVWSLKHTQNTDTAWEHPCSTMSQPTGHHHMPSALQYAEHLSPLKLAPHGCCMSHLQPSKEYSEAPWLNEVTRGVSYYKLIPGN